MPTTIKIISEEILADPDINPPGDGLAHEQHLEQIFQAIRTLDAGSVIAVQGAWGRGKSDLLWRIARRTYPQGNEPLPAGIAGRAFWLNPWVNGRNDLLSPLVARLAERLEALPKGQMTDTDWEVMGVMAAAAVTLAIKGLTTVLDTSSGGLAGPAGEMLAKLLKAKGQEAKGEIEQWKALKDPVETMAGSFSQLVNKLAKPQERLLVCVDDMDRCLPSRQVAMLEAIHFLTATNARVIFLVAIDPDLAEKSIKSHFGAGHFDPKTYLSKIFNYRFNLPAVGNADIKGLIDKKLEKRLSNQDTPLRVSLEKAFNMNSTQLKNIVDKALPVQALRNPRTVERILERLAILSVLTPPQRLNESDTEQYVRWLALAERWPEVRFCMQELVSPTPPAEKSQEEQKQNIAFTTRFGQIMRFYNGTLSYDPPEQRGQAYTDWTREGPLAFLKNLPPPQENPALDGFLQSFSTRTDQSAFLTIERTLLMAGM